MGRLRRICWRACFPRTRSTGVGPTEDDVSLLWLTDPTTLSAAVATLEANRNTAGIGQIYYGPSVALNYDVPGLPPNGDPRTPDIIVTPNMGVTYTGSNKKLEEHGGFSHDDTNVMLLMSNPASVRRRCTPRWGRCRWRRRF